MYLLYAQWVGIYRVCFNKKGCSYYPLGEK